MGPIDKVHTMERMVHASFKPVRPSRLFKNKSLIKFVTALQSKASKVNLPIEC